ncbi:MAG: hypothetical protein VCB43_12585, partial [Myxococcota bacterium]
MVPKNESTTGQDKPEDDRSAVVAKSRTALCVFDCQRPESLAQLIDDLPESADAYVSEILVVHEKSVGWSTAFEEHASQASRLPLKFHRNPRDYDYGDARKAAFEYVVAQGFDHVACLRAEGRHPAQ